MVIHGFGMVLDKAEGREYLYDVDGIKQEFGSVKSWRKWDKIRRIKYLNWYLSQINRIIL